MTNKSLARQNNSNIVLDMILRITKERLPASVCVELCYILRFGEFPHMRWSSESPLSAIPSRDDP